MHLDLHTCTDVFVRNFAIRKPFKALLDGPYINRGSKVFELKLLNRLLNISINRLKLNETEQELSSASTDCFDRIIVERNTLHGQAPMHNDRQLARKTRSGHVINTPVPFKL